MIYESSNSLLETFGTHSRATER